MEDEEPICNFTGNCQTENNDPNDLDMCKLCGALMYWTGYEWVHWSVYDEEF